MGRKLGDPADPLLVSVRSGAKFSMPGMMDTVLNLGLNDESVQGLADGTGDERFAYDSLPALHLDVRPDRARRRRRAVRRRRSSQPRRRPASKTDAEIPAAELKKLCETLQGDRQGAHDRQAVPAGPDGAAAGRHRGRVRELERRPRRSPTGCASASATTSAPPSTCRRWCSATATTTPAPASASPATPPPARTSPTATSWSTPRARTSWPASATPKTSTSSADHFPTIHDELLAIFDRLEAHYRDMCDTEFTIEQGKLWMLQTRVGKRTGAAALRMAVDMTKGQAAWKISPRGGRAARHRRAPRPGAAPAVRGHGPQRARQGPGRVARRRGGQGVLHRRRAPRRPPAGEKVILVRSETSPEDVHGMMVGQGHPHRSRRPGEPRRRRRPRLGHAGRRRRRGRSRSRASSSPVGDTS